MNAAATSRLQVFVAEACELRVHPGFEILWSWVQGLRFRTQGVGLRVSGSDVRVWYESYLGFRA